MSSTPVHHPETESFIREQTTSMTLESIVTDITPKKKKKDKADENKLQQLIHANKTNRKI